MIGIAVAKLLNLGAEMEWPDFFSLSVRFIFLHIVNRAGISIFVFDSP